MKMKTVYSCTVALALLGFSIYSTAIHAEEQTEPATSVQETSTQENLKYDSNNGLFYLDKSTLPALKIYQGQNGQIRPRQDSMLKDFQYAFVYQVLTESNHNFTIDETGKWTAVAPGKVALRITPADQEPNFLAEMQQYGIEFVDISPTVVHYYPTHFIEILPEKSLVYRLYHPVLKSHLYTTSKNEVDTISQRGWNYEGYAWATSNVTGTPVYRLYHPDLRVHLYTQDQNEYTVLGSRGWDQEGIAYYSSGDIPVYRLYHPGIKKHHYTTSELEKNTLMARGWRYEGIAWYSISLEKYHQQYPW